MSRNALALTSLVLMGLFVSTPLLAKSSKERYYVVQVGDRERMRILKASELKTLRQEIDDKYKKDLKEYSDARKAALRAKKKFTTAKPEKTPVKVLASNLLSRDVAKARVEKLKEEAAKKKKSTSRSR